MLVEQISNTAPGVWQIRDGLAAVICALMGLRRAIPWGRYASWSRKKGTAIMVVYTDVAVEHDADLNAWYNQEHLP